MKRLRRLVCCVVGHEWALRLVGSEAPIPIYRARTALLAEGVVEKLDGWVCLRCGAQVPLGQSEAAVS